jgi:predicted peptidase
VNQPHMFEQEIRKTVAGRFLLSLPAGYDPNLEQVWPTILFLHGSGERGHDLAQVKAHGLPKILEHDDLPFIVISPQCPHGETWTENLEMLGALLDHVAASHRVDLDRVYLTGLSLGGQGAWMLATEQPQRFAALVPICGVGDPWRAHRLQEIPTWAFHGGNDDVVPPEKSKEMIAAMQQLGADARLTIYENVGHDSWTQTYENPELYTWLLGHTRGASKP